MPYPTPIEWTDATWNPVGGCSVKSPGCKPCYAMQLAGTRLHKHPLYAGTTTRENGRPVFNGTMTVAPDDHPVWTWPLSWRGAREPKLGAGRPSLIFVGDMADLYHEKRDPAVIDRTVGTISQSKHIGQLLTKRPAGMAKYFYRLRERRYRGDVDCAIRGDLRYHLWLGVSAERQREFDARWPHLRSLADMGFTVFVSYEPALGPLKLPKDFLALGMRAWLIAGGVSGRWPWAPDPDWFRSVRDQCAPADVPFFFKQWGKWRPAPEIVDAKGPSFKHFRSGWMQNYGHEEIGRKLDDVEHNAFPRAA
jgi:protein gp37